MTRRPVGGPGDRRAAPASPRPNGWSEREAFNRAVESCYAELRQAAQREVRHRLALGEFAPDDPTPEELLDMVLERAWRGRRRLPPGLGVKASLLALLFRLSEAVGARRAARQRGTVELLPEEAEPDPLYEDDDEDFWQSHEPGYPRDFVVVAGSEADAPQQAADDELVGRLSPREREILLMHQVHGVPLSEAAVALGIPLHEAEQLLLTGRSRLRAAAGQKMC